MFGGQGDDDFTNDITAGTARQSGPSHWPLLIVTGAMIAIFCFWATFTEIEEVTSGEGRVIPSGQIQLVQSLEGGIVRSLDVQEGERVEAGQQLAQIDDTGFSSRLGELRRQQHALLVERSRLEAESQLVETFTLRGDTTDISEGTIQAERQLFASRRKQLSDELKVLQNRLSQREFELRELAAQEAKLQATLKPLNEEAALTRKMAQRGVVPEIELLRLESRLAELEGELTITRAAKPRVQASMEEAKNLIETTRNNYRVSARERLAKLETELAVIQETIRAASDRVTRATLVAPVRGIVNKINVTTIGAVIQPGHEVMEIVPVDDGLMIETRIRPADVAFLKPNERASVKLTAYDYLIYGDLEGEVVRIGADTIKDAEGDAFYQVIIRTDENHLSVGDRQYPVIPGMVAMVDIKTGKNTVMSYLLKPILRARKEALR